MATETSNLSSSNAVPSFNIGFLKGLTRHKTAANDSQLTAWVHAARDEGLQSFKVDLLDFPAWNAYLRGRIGASPSMWTSTIPEIVHICLVKGRGINVDPIEDMLMTFVTQIATKTRVPGHPPPGHTGVQHYKLELSYRLLLTALLYMRKNPEGVFMRLLGGERVEKGMTGDEGVEMSDDEEIDQDRLIKNHGTSLKRGSDAISSLTDGRDPKKIRIEEFKAQATLITDCPASELQALREQIKVLHEKQAEADERH
jgi:hypothetical protein